MLSAHAGVVPTRHAARCGARVFPTHAGVVRYRGCVTAAAAHEPAPDVGKTPEAIRAALLPEERDAFDADCRHALGQAVAESSLQPVREMIEHWWRIAKITQHDPAAHRRMLKRIDQTLAGDQATQRLRTWDELRAERGGQ